MTEAEFESTIYQLAKLYGWKRYHTHRSDRSESGFPDDCLVRGKRIIFAELKKEKGRLSANQYDWLVALEATGLVEVALWRPSMLDEIVAILGPQQKRATLVLPEKRPAPRRR